jgi:hypothetical protein
MWQEEIAQKRLAFILRHPREIACTLFDLMTSSFVVCIQPLLIILIHAVIVFTLNESITACLFAGAHPCRFRLWINHYNTRSGLLLNNRCYTHLTMQLL